MSKRKRGRIVSGVTHKVKTGCGALFITVNRNDQGEPLEVFCRLGKAGCCTSAYTEAFGRLISLAFRKGASIKEIKKQLIHIHCGKVAVVDGKEIFSCPDALAKILEEERRDEQTKEEEVGA